MHQPLLQRCCPLGSRHGSARIQGKTLRSGGSGASTAAAGSTKVCLHNGFTTVNINAKRATKLTRPSPAHGSSTSYYYRHVQWNPEDLERKDRGELTGPRRTHRPQMESLRSISQDDTTANESQLQDHEIVLLLDIYRKVCSC